MKSIFKKGISIICLLALIITSVSISACSAKTENQSAAKTSSVESTTESKKEVLSVLKVPVKEEIVYKGVYIEKTIDEFNALGFEYGDSVNIMFSNGFVLNDIPYYNGYYTKPGESLLVAYPGYEYIDACICFGESMWARANLKNGDTADIILNEKAKYKDNQKFFNVQYTNNRDDFSSDEVFANFRSVNIGNIKENYLYRGVSPINNKHNRAKYANNLIKQANIKYVVDLTDTEESLEKLFKADDFFFVYFKELYDNGKVSLNYLSVNYKSKEYAKTVVKALTDMSKNEGPYYIHCIEGKDRTGFVLAVIEGFAGASYEDIVKDYMITFDNYYGVNESKDKAKYDAYIEYKIDDILKYIADSDTSGGTVGIALKDLDWVNVMGRFLLDNGMTMEDMDNLYKNLMHENPSDPG